MPPGTMAPEAIETLLRVAAEARERTSAENRVGIDSDSDSEYEPRPEGEVPERRIHLRDKWCQLCLPPSINDYENTLRQGVPLRGFMVDCHSRVNERSKRCIRCVRIQRSCLAIERGIEADRAWLVYMMNSVDGWIVTCNENGEPYLTEHGRRRLGELILQLAKEFKNTQNRHRSAWSLVGANKTAAENRRAYEVAMDRRAGQLLQVENHRLPQLGIQPSDTEHNAWMAAKIAFRIDLLDANCAEYPQHMGVVPARRATITKPQNI
ncbi:hypothetical protein NLG97_g1773 [Lecanicillium saksenae]|uniref:Uncharacterized protein n=1 Tax=Lecanicillium saksenae TaxID=468837 RepID=A0ACC1R5G9_9HYPO|nr:hypothetical protein NLG97_g1773 [Lecanicillium saksenae]